MMSELVSQLITAGLLIGVLALMLSSARKKDDAAHRWRDLRKYKLGRKMWAVALLTGLALGEIVKALDGGIQGSGAVGFLAGGWCGIFEEPSRARELVPEELPELVPGAIGAIASVIGSVAFVAAGPTTLDQLMRGLIVGLLGLLFGMFAIARRKPLEGLTWFAALDIAVFCTGPLGQSWFEGGSWEGAVIALVGCVLVILLAFMPEVVIGLVACGIIVVQVGLTGTGYRPGNLLYSTGPVAITIVSYVVVLFLRGKVQGRPRT